jgi:hypothetical protein
MEKWGRIVLLFVTVTVLADQVLQHTWLSGQRVAGRALAPFDPPLFCPAQDRAVESMRSQVSSGRSPPSFFDPDLGWCPEPNSRRGVQHFDGNACRVGPRPLALSKGSDLRRILTLGCSFTVGDEVADLETWPAILDGEREDLEIANMGVAAFGMDQALLRYRRDGAALEPDEVWLGFLPVVALRVVNAYRPALRHWTALPFFKPRFVLDGEGRLELVSNPVGSLEETLHLIADQEAFLGAVGESDAWVRGHPAAYSPRGSHWSHHSSLARIALTIGEKGHRHPGPQMQDPESELFRLLLAIAVEFDRAAREDGARFRFLVLPGRSDLERRASSGRPYWEALVQALVSSGVEVIDCSAALAREGGHAQDALWAPREHYSARGNRLIADHLARVLGR